MKITYILLGLLAAGWPARAGRQGGGITDEQAIESVRQFTGDRQTAFRVRGMRDDGPMGRSGLFYDVAAARYPDGGWFQVRASDGVVTFMHNSKPHEAARRRSG